MAHTILTDVCEGVADCVDACPVAGAIVPEERPDQQRS